MERVLALEGETPLIIVAPHGVDDTNTDIIAEKVAEELGAFAVINKGWQRSQSVDYFKDLANCNDVRHLKHDVIKEEFLDPILRFSNKIKKKYEEKVFMLILHGCSDSVRDIVNEDLDMIIGFGDGDPPSYSCNIKFKNAFLHYLQKERFCVYEGRSRGAYAGRSNNNLNQLFRRWYPDDDVNSIQLEITKELRSNKHLIDVTSAGLVNAIDALMLYDDATTLFHRETKKI
jgi:hypothetical protein